MSHQNQTASAETAHTDAVIIGAGFAGVRMLIELRKLTVW